ncbi:MAG: metallophosphoesterase [Acutalibacteraceae bacterium]
MANCKKRKLKKVLSVIVIIIALIVVVTTIVNTGVVKGLLKKGSSYSKVEIENQLIPEKDENGNWVFVTDGDFKVLQLTDVHLGGGWMSGSRDKMSLNAVATMITREKPDLVIATGDIAYPVPFQAGTFNNKSGAKAFANLMETLGVYWTINFGNHDTEAYSYFDREAISKFYSDEDFKYCLFQAGPDDVDGYGNHVIEVKNSQGIITQAFVLMDSQAYISSDYFGAMQKYDNIHENQVEWYRAEIARLNEENSVVLNSLFGAEPCEEKEMYSTVKTLAFFHIPLTETADAWNEFAENGFEDTENFKYIEGIIGETGRRIYSGVGEDDLFEAMLELNSTKAIFNGHDHYNNTTFSYKDIIFSYGYSVDYLAYFGISEVGSQRGCTLITCKPDTTFGIEKFNYYSDRYDLDGFTREEVTMQFEDVEFQVEEE